MFTQRLNELFQVLGFSSSAELARRMGYEASYISVLRSGKRVLSGGSQAAAHLARSLVQAAQDVGRTEALCRQAGCDPELSGDALAAEVEAWLTREEPPRQSGRAGRKPNATAQDAMRLGSRLDGVMQLIGLSNAHLARLAAVDPSVISRYRNGRRIPDASHDAIRRIASALYRRAQTQGCLEDLSALTGVPMDRLVDEAQGLGEFQAWLLDPAAAEASVVEDFLASLDGFSPAAADLPAPAAPLAPEPVEDAAVYQGIAGLHAAVRRFLQAALDEDVKELWLYSDQSTYWMTGDPAFALDWASRMRACLKTGTRIRIVHTIDRGLEEMLAAIRNWLPLYMTGQIEGYYSQRTGGSRFSHTLFLAPDRACISAWHPAGTEETALYHYHTQARDLAEDRQRFQGLLASAQPLIRLRPMNPADVLSVRSSQGVFCIVSTLSLATLPRDLVVQMAARLGPEEGQALTREWEQEQTLYRRCLLSGSLREFVSLPGKDALDQGLVPVDSSTVRMSYTPAEFAAHLAHVRELTRTRANYHLILLPEPAFSHIRILITGGGVTIWPLIPSLAAFTVSHPMMHAAFASYAVRLQERSALAPEELQARLDAYAAEL